ncbi:MAG: gamma-glutamyltransferase [Pseudomonadota bacterium]
MNLKFILLLPCLALLACSRTETPAAKAADVPQAAYAMPEFHAGEVSRKILEQGGNAVDASIAAAFVLAVTFPEAGNIGGGGFMLMRMDNEVQFLDYRERAPSAASADMYLGESGEPIPELSLVGHKAVGVPGTVAGLWEAHQRHGTLDWAGLLEPAISLAANGFVMPEHLFARIDGELGGFAGRTNFADYFAGAKAERLFKQPELAKTLRRIALAGRDGFYHGKTAELLVAEMAANDGLIVAEDLAAYEPRWREPLRGNWRGFDLYSAPPPSSGGFAVLQLLGMKEALAEEFDGHKHNSAQYVHLVAEMEKRVFADRAEYFGDPDFVEVPIAQLTSADYIKRRAAEVNSQAISSLEGAAPGLESPDTTHFSVVDQWGNAVSNTYTLNTLFGSGVVVTGAGFLLNNEMDDFSAKPNVPNYFGVVGGSANAIAPGKRMLSSMSPTLLLKNGQVQMVVGTPGGSTIFTSVFQAIVNVYDFDMTPEEAVAATRFHHQLLPPDLVTMSPSRPLPAATIRDLTARGYRVEPHPWEFGDLQMVLRTEDGYATAADPRGRGEAGVLNIAQ